MQTHSRLRSLLSLCLILLIHLAIVFSLNWKHRKSPQPESVLSTLWIVPEPKMHKPDPVVQPVRRPTAIRPPSVTTEENASTSPESATEHLAMPDATDTPPTPHLDLDAMRAQAVQQELGREKSPIELHNEANKRNHSLEAQVEDGTNKAQRSDCRTAHAGAGLFAPLMIAADLIRDKGCKF